MLTSVALAGAAGAMLAPARAAVLARLGGVRDRPRRRGLVLALLGSALAVPMVGALPVLLVVVLTGLGRRQLRRQGALRAAQRRRDVLGELLAGLVAELRAGAEPRPAVVSAGTGLAGLEPVVSAASRPSGDVGAALVALAGEPGGSAAGELAAVWRVGETAGCGLAAPVARVLRGHRARDRLRREVAAELAGPTATAYLLSALPLVGIGLGTALGADPSGFLLGATAGRGVLAVGVVLVCTGVGWTRRIAAGATAGWVSDTEDAA